MSEKQGILNRVGRTLLEFLVWSSVGIFFVWAVGAVYYLSYLPPIFRTVLAAAYAVVGLILIVKFIRGNRGQRSRLWNPRTLLALSVVGIYCLTLTIRPSDDRHWADDQAAMARIEIDGDQVTIENFRNCDYRSEVDFDARFENRTFKLSDLSRVWFIVQKFTTTEGLAHTFLTFEYNSAEGPKYVSLSVEIWREQGDTYSPIRGLYREYEITHVIGSERDLIGVRTVHRPNDRVYMFPVNAASEDVQKLWLRFARRIDELAVKPRFYHTLLNNCTNGITRNTYELTPEAINWMDPSIVLPGFSGEFAFNKGLVGNKKEGQSFAEFKNACRIDEKARAAGITERFSADIRAPHSQ